MRPGWQRSVVRKALGFALISTVLLTTDTFLHAQKTLRIAAAADLEPVLPGLIAAYEKQSGQHVEASYQSSATLAAQIENGAPFDLCLSADMSFPEKLIADGLADSERPT